MIRPPWAIAKVPFELSCERCDACAKACPEQIIVADTDGFPSIDFKKGECTFCGACAEACTSGTLWSDGPKQGAQPWSLKADMGPACLSVQGVTCRACGDHCDENAIQFHLMTGGRAIPTVSDACTGCGACVRPCPVDAVTIAYSDQLQSSKETAGHAD